MLEHRAFCKDYARCFQGRTYSRERTIPQFVWCRSTLTRQPLTTSRETRRSSWRASWAWLEAPWDSSLDSPSSAGSRSSSISSGWSDHQNKYKNGVFTYHLSLSSGWSPPSRSGKLMLWLQPKKSFRTTWCKKIMRRDDSNAQIFSPWWLRRPS